MKKNIFVLGMTAVQLDELRTVDGSENYEFHDLLGYERLVKTTGVDFGELLAEARAELDRFDGTVDAIVTHWDFPASIIGPLLAREHDLPSPSLESLLKCEHKYWSRLEQKVSIPECVPRFASFDPFDDDPLAAVDLDFPFWVKPVKSHSSDLGFEVRDAEQFNAAVAEIRAGIGEIGDAFNEVLDMVDLPPELAGADGNTCLAEQFVTGVQAAPEGTVFAGSYSVHGVLDMHKDAAGTSFERLDYPADSVPAEVQRRMIDATERFLRHIGFDNGAFNAEYMWDEEADKIWLIEVNTRISQSHSELFAHVDGVSNHTVAIDIALGREPRMPHRKGEYAVASQCMIFHDEDALVTKIPGRRDKESIAERYPGTRLTLQVTEGDRLSELPHQDSYRYIIGKLYIGARDRAELQKHYDEIVAGLPFEFAPVPGGEDAS
ncbi:ATP-grasp domain-containing protein [Phytomonospora sp. NPDC050363]|uniref:ATP-grasp domain-containing protein n=1 Tax=Phytomonospora sp. NPDC050363 TaxID=3155642 RepID=UPI0033C65AC4